LTSTRTLISVSLLPLPSPLKIISMAAWISLNQTSLLPPLPISFLPSTG
jgi:hypothetical protein